MIIALFTDFGSRDAYVAQMKGVILGINPGVTLVDLTHDVACFDIQEAAYLLDQAVSYLPAGVIVVAVVDPGVGTSRRPVLLETEARKWYVGPDNGLFTNVVQRENLATAYLLHESAYYRQPATSMTFHGRDIFAPAAAHLALGVPPERFGPPLAELMLLPQARPEMVNGVIDASVQHIDHFGNVITNLRGADLCDIELGRQLRLTVGETLYLPRFCRTYGGASQSELICLINSNEAFEIAVPQGQAATYLNVQTGDRIRLEI